MLKLWGAAFVIFSCGICSLLIISRRKTTRLALLQLSCFLSELARSIGYNLEPLPVFFARKEKDTPLPLGSFVKTIAANLNSGQALPTIWQNALLSFAKESHLPDSAVRIVSALSDVGQTDFESEKKRLESAAFDLKQLAAELEKESAPFEKTCKTLGLLLGVLIVIILV